MSADTNTHRAAALVGDRACIPALIDPHVGLGKALAGTLLDHDRATGSGVDLRQLACLVLTLGSNEAHNVKAPPRLVLTHAAVAHRLLVEPCCHDRDAGKLLLRPAL